MPGQKTSGGTGLRICPPPPKGFDPFTASKVDLARHGLPLRPDPQTQPDLAALWDRLADRYRDFEHLEPRPDTATAGKKAAEKAVAPRVLPLDPQESCGYSLFGSQAAPFTALFATWTVPDLRYSPDPYGPNYFRTFVSLGFLDIHTEMSVDSAQHITCGLWAEGTRSKPLPHHDHQPSCPCPFYQPLLSCATAAGRQKPKHLSWRRQRQRATPRTHAVMQKRATAPPCA